MLVRGRLILAAAAVCIATSGGLDVADMARDFFVVRDVDVIVVAVANRDERLGVFRALASDGRFQVAVPDEDGATAAEVLNAKERTRIGILLRGSVAQWVQPGDIHWFNASYHWLIVDDGRDVEVDGLAVRLESEVYRARPAGDQMWQLEEMIRMNLAGPTTSWLFAQWTSARGLVSTDTVHFGGNALEERRSQLRRIAHEPTSVIAQTALFEEKRPDRDTFEHIFEVPPDVVLQHFNYLSIATYAIAINTFERYNFTVKSQEYEVSGELDLPPSGHFAGASGAVQRGAADLVSTGLLMSLGRLRHFIFAPTTYHLKIVCLFLADGSLGTADALLTPFHWLAWLSTVVVAVAGLLLHWHFRKLEGRDITWSESLLTSVGSLTGHGYASAGEWISGRILLLVFEILFMLMQGYYSSSIVKFLLRPLPPSVRDVRGLLHSNYPVALHDWWLIIREFETATTGIPRQLYEKKIRPPRGLGYMTHEELARVLVRPLHAVIGSQENVYRSTTRLNEGQACRLHEMNVMPPQHIAPIISRDCAYKEAIYAGFLLQRERGILQRVTTQWEQRRPRCSGDGAHGEGDPIGLQPVLPVLGVMAFGILAAPVIAVVERTRWRPEVR